MRAGLTAARTLRFTAVATYESPARTGAPLAYTTRSELTLERPDKLRVLTLGDGPPPEICHDGKTLQAYAPWAHLTAVAEAAASIDATLRQLYHISGTCLPYSDVIVAEPCNDLVGRLPLAFAHPAAPPPAQQ
jgi:hypothetical protein